MIGGRLRPARSTAASPPAHAAIRIPSSHPGATGLCCRVVRDVLAAGVPAGGGPAVLGRSPLTGRERVLSGGVSACPWRFEASEEGSALRSGADEVPTAARSRLLGPRNDVGSRTPPLAPGRGVAAARGAPTDR